MGRVGAGLGLLLGVSSCRPEPVAPSPARPDASAEAASPAASPAGPAEPPAGPVETAPPPPDPTPTGTLCVAKIEMGTTPGKGASTAGREAADGQALVAAMAGPLTVRLDGVAVAQVDGSAGARVDGLDLDARPMLSVVNGSGRGLSAFPLRFSDPDSRVMCLRFGSFYGAWMLDPWSGRSACGPCAPDPG